MVFRIDPSLPHQLNAVSDVIGVFHDSIKLRKTIYSAEGAVPNPDELDDDKIFENLQEIQKENKLKISTKLSDPKNFSVDMETGTGKTYVYLRTIFELHKNYGFKKFIITVPSVAIKEGVLEQLDNLKAGHHFEGWFNAPYEYFKYESDKVIDQIPHFQNNDKIMIMIITRDSFNMESNIINQEYDNLNGKKPIDLLGATHPVLILDEPQNFESELTVEALAALKPIFTLRYSATHRTEYDIVHRLTPAEAHRKRLVKKIQVMATDEESNFNNIFLRCDSINPTKSNISATLSVYKMDTNGFKEKKQKVKVGDNLGELTENPDYDMFTVKNIDATDDQVEFENGVKLKTSQPTVNRDQVMETQIENTIKNHFKKVKELKKLGIKPLTLFFIDAVNNYQGTNPKIKNMFEKHFKNIQNSPDYKKDFAGLDVDDVQGAYFSEMRQNRSIENDQSMFQRIMKDKEGLISFNNPIEFIFSHSALREGWDNPNVFTICTLNETKSNMKKRQEIGRGMRLPVDQQNVRDVKNEYMLTVVTNEHYSSYVRSLQTEYEEAGIINGTYTPGNAREIVTVKLKQNVLKEKNFQDLWKKLSQKTMFTEKFDSTELIKKSIELIDAKVSITQPMIVSSTVSITPMASELVAVLTGSGQQATKQTYEIPDLLSQIVNKTGLTRKTISEIIIGTKKLDDINKNPAQFITEITDKILQTLHVQMVDGLEYSTTGDVYNVAEFAETMEKFEDNVVELDNSVYDKISCDADTEKKFIEDLKNMAQVKLLIKLPDWFTVDTPVGTYNTDWAMVIDNVDQYGKSHGNLFLIADTKGALDPLSLRGYEKIKTDCAKKHFDAIGLKFEILTSATDLQNWINKQN